MDKVTVLMSTYNGEKYIKDQINSIINQCGVDISLIIRDDKSTDGTVDIIRDLAKKHKNIQVVFDEKNIGACLSFLRLIEISENMEAEYYAFCDQDDIWLPEKIMEAIKTISKSKMSYSDTPILYCSAVTFVDENLNIIRKAGLNDEKMTFEKSVYDNRSIGCTLVFNQALIKKYLRFFKENKDSVVMHDWTFVLLTLLTGEVMYDSESYIYYRQHSGNLVGGINKNKKLTSKLLDFYRTEIKGSTKHRSRQLLFINNIFANDMSDYQLEFVNNFFEYYRKNIFFRILYILSTPVPGYSNNVRLKLSFLYLIKKL